MAEVAAHLTDHVLPHLPVRQWVLSLPDHLQSQVVPGSAPTSTTTPTSPAPS